MAAPLPLQEANGGAGVYSADMRKHYQLQDPQWRHDMMPEIMDGHNVLDFVDPDIEAQLAALEREEEELAAAAAIEVGCGSGRLLSTLPSWGALRRRAGFHQRRVSLLCRVSVLAAFAKQQSVLQCHDAIVICLLHMSWVCHWASAMHQCQVPAVQCLRAALWVDITAISHPSTLPQGMEMDLGDAEALSPDERELLKRIRARRKVVVAEHRLKKGTSNNQAVLPRNADRDRKSTTSQMRVSVLRPSLLQLQVVQAHGPCESDWGARLDGRALTLTSSSASFDHCS